MEKIKIEGLYEAARRAYMNMSFDPEKRAEGVVKDFEEELNKDIETIQEGEKDYYIERYKKFLFDYLSAKSRCLSAMITGPANFPVERNKKYLAIEDNRFNGFRKWREKALKSIAKKVEEAKPQSEKDAEIFCFYKEQVDDLFNGYSRLITGFAKRVETLAKNGRVELVQSILDYLNSQQIEKNKIVATPKHSVWLLADVAKTFRASLESVKTAESTESEINGVRVVKNIQADRIQLFFDGKPEPDMISKLKGAAFRWSPTNGCWQRQLTQNAIYATNRILSL